MSWDSFHIVFIRCCGIAALLTNTLMFHLICYKSPKNLGAYKYLMLYSAVFEELYAILDIIALPDSITLRSALLTVVSSKKNHMPKELLPVLNVLYWALYGISIALIDIHFLFRYLVVTGIKQRVNWNSVTAIIAISANVKQLFLALVLQTIIPLVLMYLPSGVLLFFCFTDQSFELFGRIMSTTAAVHRVLDPLPNMFVINKYRNALTSYCGTIFCLKSNVTKGVTSGTAASSSLEMK
ncbi:hypothetical protein GCK72_002770 [Caenorhabditis remanei]|uniref:G-protein coupled receptors family 1 profile domain-containing protein n=1 Tax=Caenorhabditis remanei TaxID=31234 RepID=A0A6A5HVU9_CAERE|nr:hypothetical protein GCK72_002770 [Caenorhabditis remanei]KAF1770946.1 hypothetical protein GCK72_002770 [Caenorhabditis remanei]